MFRKIANRLNGRREMYTGPIHDVSGIVRMLEEHSHYDGNSGNLRYKSGDEWLEYRNVPVGVLVTFIERMFCYNDDSESSPYHKPVVVQYQAFIGEEPRGIVVKNYIKFIAAGKGKGTKSKKASIDFTAHTFSHLR